MAAGTEKPLAEQVGERMTSEELQQSCSCELGISDEELFQWVADFPRLPEWMPMMKRAWVDNENAEKPGEVGAVRMIDSGVGKPTEETVVAFERPRYLAYSASDASLFGMYTNHLGVLACEPTSEGKSRLTWLSYARPGKNPIMRFFGRHMFNFMITKSIKNLQKRFPV